MHAIINDIAEVITVVTYFTLAEDAASLQARFARASDRFPAEGFTHRFPVYRSAVITWLAASTPCGAKAPRGEPSGAMHWIDSMIIWSHTTLKSGFRSRTNLLSGVQASDAFDLPMVGYLLELFPVGAGATMLIRQPSSARF
jgi:hypothetical protein